MGNCAGCLSFAIFLFLSCGPQEVDKDVRPPNVILIMTDDQGWGDLSYNGNTNLNTPNIDKLASESADFDRFYVCPVCSPTRAELLTGRYHTRGGVYSTSAGGERLDLDETTMADVFKAAGYHTAAYGKWHNGMQPPYHPNARGFDDFYGFCSGHWGHYFSPMLEHNGEITKGDGFLVDDFTTHGLDFMEEHREDPFFLYLPYNTPHSPMQVPDRWWTKFADQELPKTYAGEEAENIQHTRAALAMCENVDWNVGRILDKVEELDITRNTIIIYLSDNGPNGWRWNGGMRGRKGSTDEGGVRSPLFIKWTDKIKPRKINQISSVLDLLPTLTEMAGISPGFERKLDGMSLASTLLEGRDGSDQRVIINYWRGKTSVRNQTYRLDNAGRLYNMDSDPGQETEVLDQPEIKNDLMERRSEFARDVVSELPEIDSRPFTAGHPDFEWTQLPARDATATGQIQRSNRYPNDSYFKNWIDADDSIYWDVELLSPGNFEVIVYYTLSQKNIGCSLSLTNGVSSIRAPINTPHDPPEVGAKEDRDLRQESYVKDFKPTSLGTIHLHDGAQRLRLLTSDIIENGIDFRLLVLRRI